MYIRLDDAGEGVKRAIITILLLETISPKLVLWDDFGSTEHPSLLKKEIQWLSKKDWQVVLATHSIDVLYELLDSDIEDLNILLLNKKADDTTVFKSLSIDELNGLMNGNSDPRLLVEALGV